MVARVAFSDEALSELGWMTVVYTYLEECIANFASAFEDPSDPKLHIPVIARKGLCDKLKLLRYAALQAANKHSLAPPASELDATLNQIRNAAERRDDLVHGFVKLGDSDAPGAQRIHKARPPHPITPEEVRSTTACLYAARDGLEKILVPLWNDIVRKRLRSP